MTDETFEIEVTDPASGRKCLVLAKLQHEGCYTKKENAKEEWLQVLYDPEFYEYTVEDLETEAIGIMPESWKGFVDVILCNVYWDRRLYR